MKRIGIFHHNESNENVTTDLVRDIQTHTEAELISLNMREVIVRIRDGEVTMVHPEAGDLRELDAMYLRSNTAAHVIRGVIAQYAVAHGVPLANPETAGYQPYDKVSQNVRLALAGVPVGDTTYVFNGSLSEEIANELGWPQIAKAIVSSKGDDNYRVQSFEGLQGQVAGREADFIFQANIPNDRDYRCIVVGGSVAAVYQRSRNPEADTHLNNKAKGGTVTYIEQPDEALVALAEEANAAMGRMSTGVDVIPNIETGELVVLEVNYVSDSFHNDNADAPEVVAHAKYLESIACD